MPELPEVETVARQLEPHLVGRSVRRLTIHDALLAPTRPPVVAGRTIESVRRSGKQVLIGFSGRPRDSEPLWLAVHLRMTGRLLWHDGSPERAHLRATFRLDRGTLAFNDTRRFGTFKWFRREEEAEPAATDPLDRRFDAKALGKLIGKSDQSLKAWLLRQDRLVGIGNIYASEILHAAELSPTRSTRTLEEPEIRALHKQTRRILRRAIKACGTTFSDFQDAHGLTGSYQQYLAVYEREGEPCRRCAGAIRKIVQQQRSTYFCPDCQR